MTAIAHSARPSATVPTAAVRTQVTVPLRFSDGFKTTAEVVTFHGLADGKEHLLLALGPWEQALLAGQQAGADQSTEGPLVRLHSECLTGDVFGSERCDCGPQLREAVEQISVAGGFLLYLRQEGRGIGLYSKLDAYALQDTGMDTYEANLALGHGADERDYTAAAQMLNTMGAHSVRLLTNNPDKSAQLTDLGVTVAELVPTGVHLTEANRHYLTAKRDKTAHTLTVPAAVAPEAAVEPAAEPSLKEPAAHPGAGQTPVPAAVVIPSDKDLLARVAALIPNLRERAADTEQRRQLPAETMAELHAAGVFRILAPRSVGGYGMGAGTYAGVVRLLARGCASTAWTAGHLIEHAWMLARWPEEIQAEVFANGTMPLAAATSAPVGAARQVPGGYLISGHWGFASGIMHSEWALLAVEYDGARLQCLVPVAEVEIQDAWHTDGLRGTGSHDVVVQDLFVPGHHVADWALLSSPQNPGSFLHPEPLLHAPMSTLLNVVGPSVALGSAEAALELFEQRLRPDASSSAAPAGRRADSPLLQARYAQAFGKVASARLLWREALAEWTTPAGQPGADADSQRAHFRLLLGLSADAAHEAVRLVLAGSGASVHRLSHPLQRIQRDVGVLVSHPTLALDPILEQAGRGLLGLGITARSF